MANNLRSLCVSRCKSIAQACEEMGINRQQFAKYTSAKAIPRRKTLQKICQFFEIRDIDLFSDFDENLDDLRQQSQSLLTNKEVLSVLAQVNALNTPTISDGIYMTYFYTPLLPSFVLRSVTVIRSDHGKKYFRRLTGYGENYRSDFRVSLGHHRGIIIENSGDLLFLALDKLSSQMPTMLALKWSPTKNPILSGKGIIRTSMGAEVCSVVMEKLPTDMTWKQAVAESFAMGINEGELRLHIRNALKKS